MNKALQAVISISWLVVLGCQQKPLDRKYNSQTWWADIREGSSAENDSINHAFCDRAVMENSFKKRDNTKFTYQELIKQGEQLPPIEQENRQEQNLKEEYLKEKNK